MNMAFSILDLEVGSSDANIQLIIGDNSKDKENNLNKIEQIFNLDNIESFTLLSIATSKSAQGKGIGSGLISAFNDEMRKLGERYYLSVQDTNARAIGFYKKMGFEEVYKCIGEIQMIKKL